MIEFGKSLIAAREAKGYTVRQLSEMTRMAPSTIQDLEAENFSHLAAPIYGRGFVKLYCEAVGVDPKPFIEEFMEIYNGNHQPDIRERPLPDSSTAAAAPAADLPDEEPPVAKCAPPSSQPPVPDSEPDLFQQTSSATVSPEAPLSRYAAPIRHEPSAFNPQAALRIGILAGGALILLVLLLWGFRSVYRATTRSGEDTPPVSTPAKTDVKPGVRTPQKIPSLYLN